MASPPPFPIVLPWKFGCRGGTDEVRITIPHEFQSFHEVVLRLLQVLSLLRNAPGTIIKTSHHTALHMLDGET